MTPVNETPFPDEPSASKPRSTAPLPNPGPLAERVALAAVEILHGFRNPQQLREYMVPHLYKQLADAAGLAHRCGQPTRMPGRVMSSRLCEPADGVCEATIVIHDSRKPRACAVRLNAMHNKWKVTALDVV